MDFDNWNKEVIDFVLQSALVEERQPEPTWEQELNDHSSGEERVNVHDAEPVEDDKGLDGESIEDDEVDGEAVGKDDQGSDSEVDGEDE